MNDLELQKHTLSNGLRVLIVPMQHTRSATVSIFCGCGSRYEPYDLMGLSHFLEHMLFKGTRRRPEARDISEAIERVGGMLNASTGREATVFWAKVAVQHLEIAFDLLSDILLESLFRADDMERERSVILEEIEMYKDTPADWVHVLMSRLLWPQHPLGEDIAGREDTIIRITRADLLAHLEDFYRANNLVLAVAGNVDSEEVLRAAQMYFGRLRKGTGPAWLPAAATRRVERVLVQAEDNNQVQLCLGGEGLSHFDPDRHALSLLSTALGEGMSSRLFVEVRERLGLAYDIYSYADRYFDTGSLVISAGVDQTNLREALSTIWEQVDRLRQDRLPPEEMEKVREFTKGRLVLSMEDSWNVANWYGSQEVLLGSTISVDEMLELIESISASDILRVAQRIFTPDWAHLALIGPGLDVHQLEELVTAWH
jgi:predicted Zn-dependent peptidase